MLSLIHIFPVDFIHSLEIYFGEERVRRLISALAGEPSLSVRANPAKISAEKLAEHFSDDVDGIVPVSYTHLDVYKRQVLVNSISRRETPWEESHFILEMDSLPEDVIITDLR